MEFKCDFITIFYECCIKISWQFKNLGNCLPGICEREPLAGHHAPEYIDDRNIEQVGHKELLSIGLLQKINQVLIKLNFKNI